MLYDVMEFYGKGDPFFGGKADDRSLCADGVFRAASVRCLERDEKAKRLALFRTLESAEAAGRKASNRREGGLIGAAAVREGLYGAHESEVVES